MVFASLIFTDFFVGVILTKALWLGVANPLVLFHLVSGAHNEALMIGLMLVGRHFEESRLIQAASAFEARKQ